MIWYNCIPDSISDWNIFFVFYLFSIVLTCRFRNACARLIFIELFINKVNLHSFFFSFLSLYNLIYADAKMISLIFYEALVRWLYVDSENIIEIWYLRSAYNTSALRQYFNKAFIIFCDNLINVYYWQINTCVSSTFSRCSFNDDHCYCDLLFIFWWLYFEFVIVSQTDRNAR